MAHWWTLVPGIALVAVSYFVTFIGLARRSRSLSLAGARMRYLGIGLLFLLLGTGDVIASLVDGLQVGTLVLGIVMVGFGALWFYAASDQIFR
ncbi:MAG: hypothetical protein M3R49_05450 [Chloroflexota bacterium]|nr:hypothetical protein [Chloroflexota bacterium]